VAESDETLPLAEDGAIALATLHAGLQQALERFLVAAKRRDPRPAFYALFEALNWTASIIHRVDPSLDDLARTTSPEDLRKLMGPGVPPLAVLRGVRFARNRTHHHCPDALELASNGVTFPPRFPLTFFDWKWRSELPLTQAKRTIATASWSTRPT
jgi:hypothetical protein